MPRHWFFPPLCLHSFFSFLFSSSMDWQQAFLKKSAGSEEGRGGWMRILGLLRRIHTTEVLFLLFKAFNVDFHFCPWGRLPGIHTPDSRSQTAYLCPTYGNSERRKIIWWCFLFTTIQRSDIWSRRFFNKLISHRSILRLYFYYTLLFVYH